MESTLLDVCDLRTSFYTQDGVIRAVRGISFSLYKGETLGIVGESGSGKSVSMLSLLRLIAEPPGRIESGQALFQERDLLKMSVREIRAVRGRSISMIFQDPMTSLNPVLTIGTQIMESLQLHLGMSKPEASERAAELLDAVGIPNASRSLQSYPHQLSGGMRQRAMIAMALSCRPLLLIADEPTTALDVTIQAQIIRLVKTLQEQLGLSVIWITHDLGVVARIAQRVLVMYAGKIVEEAPVKELFGAPHHPYTQGLLRSLPRLDQASGTELACIRGQPPDLAYLPKGCAFAARCGFASPRCLEGEPPLENINQGHKVACWEAEAMENVV